MYIVKIKTPDFTLPIVTPIYRNPLFELVLDV